MYKYLNYKSEFLEAVRKSIIFAPMLFSITISYVIVADSLGLNDLEIVLWSALMFAGSVQIAVLSAYAGGAGLLESMLVAFMTGLRLGFVAMSIFTYVRDISKKVLPFFSFFIVDPAAGIIPAKAKEGGENISVFAFFFLISLWLQWVLFAWLVVIVGPFIPAAWDHVFAFAAPAVFIGLAFLMIQDNFSNGIIVISTAAAMSLLFTFIFSPQLASIITAVIAAMIGVVVEEKGRVSH